jgi:hypothetical protein
MAEKYHISKSNKPVLCEATVRNCPRGHYATVQEAQEVVLTNAVPDTTWEAETLREACRREGIYDPNAAVDHEGLSLTQRWENLHKLAETPETMTESQFIGESIDYLDTGRLRAASVVWLPAGEYPDPSEDYAAVTSANWDEKMASGAKPIIDIYTRNGGGNRDCYCDASEDDHVEGCLSVINDRMQNHPDYITDGDNFDDHTYASFMFNVRPERYDKLKEVISTGTENQAGINARTTVSFIQQGVTNVTNLFPPNPKTFAKKKALEKKESANWDAVKKTGATAQRVAKEFYIGRGGSWSDKTNTDVKEMLDAHAKGEPVPNKGPQYAALRRACAQVTRNRAKLAEAEKSKKELADTVEAMKKLSPELTEQLLSKMTPKKESATATQNRKKNEALVLSVNSLHYIVNKYDKQMNEQKVMHEELLELGANMRRPSTVGPRK